MRCENCSTNISQEFKYALTQNICPACGKIIMGADKLASFLSLQELLKNNFKDLEAEKIASLIVSNFDLKQIFREELPKEVVAKKTEENEADETHKKKQIKEAKKILKEMRDKALGEEDSAGLRDEVLNEAIADQWGLGNANGLIGPEDIRIEADREKKRLAQENIVTGSSGAFRRSS